MLPLEGWLKQSLADYPGHISTVVFTAGCNFRCPFCHNPALVPVPAQGYTPRYSPDEIMAHLEKRRAMLDGICVTGGEPLFFEDLIPFLAKIKNAGFKVKVDTNGSFPVRLGKLLDENIVDYIAMDIKAPPEKMSGAIGLDGHDVRLITKNIKKSLDLLRESGIDYELRTTVVPGLTTPEDFYSISEWIGGGKRYALQQFNPRITLDPSFGEVKTTPEETLKEAGKILSGYFEEVIIRSSGMNP